MNSGYLFAQVVAVSSYFYDNTYRANDIWDNPFKTSAFSMGGRVSPLMAKLAKCRRLFGRGGGHFVGMSMVADRWGVVGVKNRENLLMS